MFAHTPPLISEHDKQTLKLAIINGEFEAYFQPKLNLISGKIIGFETLARWIHADYGVLTPSFFLANVKKQGLIDDFFINQAIQCFQLWCTINSAGSELQLSLNIEIGQLNDHLFYRQIRSLMHHYQIPASNLTFEITEAESAQLSDNILQNIYKIRQTGVFFSLDDFGTGYSSLERLCKIPFSEIKLDAYFVQGCETDICKQAIISHVVGLAATMHLVLIVEGVETEAQRDCLISLGVIYGQGYLFAAPMNANTLKPWLFTQKQ